MKVYITWQVLPLGHQWCKSKGRQKLQPSDGCFRTPRSAWRSLEPLLEEGPPDRSTSAHLWCCHWLWPRGHFGVCAWAVRLLLSGCENRQMGRTSLQIRTQPGRPGKHKWGKPGLAALWARQEWTRCRSSKPNRQGAHEMLYLCVKSKRQDETNSGDQKRWLFFYGIS